MTGGSGGQSTGEGSLSSGSGAGGETVPVDILDENSILSGSGSTGTHSQDSVSQNPISTNPQPGAGISTSVTDDISSSTGLVSGSNGINTNEPNQTGDEFSPILSPNTPDGSGLGNTPSSGFGPATGESVNQIISDTSGKIR